MVLRCCQWNYVFSVVKWSLAFLVAGDLETYTRIVIHLLGCWPHQVKPVRPAVCGDDVLKRISDDRVIRDAPPELPHNNLPSQQLSL